MSRRVVGVVLTLGLLLAATLVTTVAQTSGPFYAPNGSRQQPAYSYTSSPRLGRYRIEQDNEGFAADGVLRWHYSTTLMHLTGINLRVGGSVVTQAALGVATDNPTATLHVNGSAAVSGLLSIGGLSAGGTLAASVLHAETTLAVNNAATVGRLVTGASGATIGGALHAQTTLAVNNQAIVGGLQVGNTTHLTGTLAVNNAATVGRIVSGTNAHMQGSLTVGGETTLGGSVHATGAVRAGTAFSSNVHAVSVAALATGVSNAEVLTAATPIIRVQCLAAQCDLHMLTGSLNPGTIVRIVNVGPNPIRLFDVTTAGRIMHVATTFTGSQNATIQFVLMSDGTGNDTAAWYELSRSAN